MNISHKSTGMCYKTELPEGKKSAPLFSQRCKTKTTLKKGHNGLLGVDTFGDTSSPKGMHQSPKGHAQGHD